MVLSMILKDVVIFRMGSWQYLAEMPYSCVSMMMRWKLLWLLHHNTDEMADLDFTLDSETCRAALQGTFICIKISRELGIYILYYFLKIESFCLTTIIYNFSFQDYFSDLHSVRDS